VSAATVARLRSFAESSVRVQHLAEQDVVGEMDQRRREVAEHALCAGRFVSLSDVGH
jgi:hypothetical protein